MKVVIWAAVCALALLSISGCGADKPGLSLNLNPGSVVIQEAVNSPQKIGIMNVSRSDGVVVTGVTVTNSNPSCVEVGPESGASGTSVISRCIPMPGQCSATTTVSVPGAQATGEVTCEITPGD